jgi:prepilin-type N-terminal cleavage/methylation domain-containing protein
MLRRPDRRLAGVTLAEMLVVVAILSVVGALAIPQASSISPQVADAGAAEVARALRFAQREAIRTGTWQQVSADPVKQELRVYQADASSGIIATHPVDKREYKISFAENAMQRATIVSAVFQYEGGPTTTFASFGPDGAPSYLDPNKMTQAWSLFLTGSPDIDPLKVEGKITLRYANQDRVVRIAPVTGRVTF